MDSKLLAHISNIIPYIGEYTDEQNVIHKFIVGGKSIEEGYGYEEHLFDGNGKFLGSSGYYGSKVYTQTLRRMYREIPDFSL